MFMGKWLFCRKRQKKRCPVCQDFFVNLPSHLLNLHKWSRESANSAIGQYQLRKKKEQKNKKNYHYEKVCPIEGCLKVSKNLGEHFRSKTHSLKPGSEYYRLLKIAKRYEPLNPSADAELSPKEYLKRKYHTVLTQELDLSPTRS